MDLIERLKKKKILNEDDSFNRNKQEQKQVDKQQVKYSEIQPISKYNGGIQTDSSNVRHVGTEELNKDFFNKIQRSRVNPVGTVWDSVKNLANNLYNPSTNKNLSTNKEQSFSNFQRAVNARNEDKQKFVNVVQQRRQEEINKLQKQLKNLEEQEKKLKIKDSPKLLESKVNRYNEPIVNRNNVNYSLSSEEEIKQAKKITADKLYELTNGKIDERGQFNKSLSTVGATLENVGLGALESVNNTQRLAEKGSQVASKKIISKVLQDKGIQKETADSVGSVLSDEGVKQFESKVLNRNTAKQNDDLLDNAIQRNIFKASGEGGKKLAEMGTQLGSNSVNMLLGAFNPFAGATTTFASASGSYVKDAEQRGMTDEQQLMYALPMATAEAGTEYVGLKSISKAGKGLKALVKGGNSISKELAQDTTKKVLKDYGVSIADNIIQEAIIDPIQELTAGIVGGKDKANWNDMAQRMLEDGLNGGLFAMITGGASLGVQSCVGVLEKVNTGAEITNKELINAVKDSSKRSNPKDVILSYMKDNLLEQDTSKIQENLAQEQSKIEEQQKLQRLQELKNIDTSDMKLLEKTNIKREIRALEQGYNSIEEYEEAERLKVEKAKQEYKQKQDNKAIENTKKSNYQMQHRPTRNGIGYDITSTESIGKDFYTNPENYIDMSRTYNQESYQAIKSIQGNPEAEITVYRASPVKELNNGDWISLSKEYATMEAQKENVQVNEFKVKAKDIQWAGDDINEFGYFPTVVENNQNSLYNSNEMESEINGGEKLRQSNTDVFEQFINETNTESQKTTNAREDFEKRFREATRKRITDNKVSENSKKNRKLLKDVYDVDTFFIENNPEFSGGADEKIKLINLTQEIANSTNSNVVTGHELFEVIRNTREDIKNEYIEPLIDVVKNDNNFNEILKKYIDNCETKDKQLLLDNPRYIAKEILFDEAGFMFNEDEFKLGVNKQETDLTRFSDYLSTSKSILQMGLSNIEQKARKSNITSINEKTDNLKVSIKEKTLRTVEEIANDGNITDLQAFQEATGQLDTPSNEVLRQKENELNNQGIEKSPTIDYIKKKRSKEKVSAKEIKDFWAQKFINKGHYIDKLAKQTGNDNLTYLYDRTMNSFNEAQISIGDYQVNSRGEKIGKSIIDIFEPANKAKLSVEFDDYLLNKHNISRFAYEKGVFGSEVSATDSKKVVDYYEGKYPKFKEWSKEVSQYNDNNLKDLVDNGMISNDMYRKLREMYEDYVPTYRDLIDNISQYVDNSVGGNTLRNATQSDRDILSVAESMAEQTIAIKKAIRMNNLGVELYNTIGKKTSKTFKGVEFSDIAIQSLAGNVIEKATDGSNRFIIFQDGEMTKFKISDELYTAFSKDTIQNKINNSKVAKTLLTPVEKMSKVQRELLTTYSIGFAFNNPIKDIQDGLFNSKYGGAVFAKNYTKALYNIGIKGSWYESYKNNGGTANTYFDYSKGILPIKTKNPFKKFGNAIRKVNEVIEQAPRLAEYISTIEHGGSIDQALYNAAEVTTNFKRGGDVTKAVNKYGANFLNASVQGLDKLYRNLSGQRGWKGYANILTKATLYQIAPAIINGLLLGDDEDYEDLPEYTKDNYFLFKMENVVPILPKFIQDNFTVDGKFFRLPKGRVSSVVGGIARRCLEVGQEKDVDWNSLVDTIINQLAPNNPFSDNIIAPIKQAVKNETWYGGDIVSNRLKKLPLKEQYDEATDELSRFIGNKLNISPKKINYILDQYSGGIGDVLLPMMTPQAENNILEDKFTTDAVMKNKHVSEYYSKLEELEKNKNSQNATDEDKLKYKYMTEVSKELGELYNQKRIIQNSDKKDKDKKREIREVQKRINAIVEDRLEKFTNIKTTKFTAKVGESEYYKYHDEWTRLTDEEKSKNKNISLKSYANYKNETYNLMKEKKKSGEIKENEQLKNKDKIEVLLNSKYTDREKEEIYKNYIGTEDKKIQLVDKLGLPITEYFKYKQQEFKNDKDEEGETVSGTKKQKVYNYLNSIDDSKLSMDYKKIICKLENINDYNSDIVNFVNNSKNLTADDRKELLKIIGFKVDKYGNITNTIILPITKNVK